MTPGPSRSRDTDWVDAPLELYALGFNYFFETTQLEPGQYTLKSCN